METSHLLPVLAAVANAIGFILYNRQSKAGTSVPNPVSWFIWAFLSVVNLLTFRALSDTFASLQFFVGSAGCIITFLYVFAIGKFAQPTRTELAVLVIALGAATTGMTFDNPRGANLMVALGLLISFEPTLQNVVRNPASEKPLPWILWTVAFALTGLNAYLFNGGWSLTLTVPLLNVIMDAIPPLLYYRHRALYQ